jgi:membrane protease YdiL (CAAX protease family)
VSRIPLPSKRPDVVADVTSDTILAVVPPVLGLVLGELVLAAGLVQSALWAYVATLLFCTLLPLRVPSPVPVLAGFALLTVFRLVNLSMPVFLDLTVLWVPLVYAPFPLAGMWYLRRSEAVEPLLDPRGTLLWTPAAVVVGAVVGAVESRLVDVPSLLPTVTGDGLWLLGAVVVVGVIAEEVLLRGVLQSALRRSVGPWFGVGTVAVVFATMQAAFGGTAVALALGAGVIYGLGYELSESLVVPIVCRGTVNLSLMVVLPAVSAGVVPALPLA